MPGSCVRLPVPADSIRINQVLRQRVGVVYRQVGSLGKRGKQRGYIVFLKSRAFETVFGSDAKLILLANPFDQAKRQMMTSFGMIAKNQR